MFDWNNDGKTDYKDDYIYHEVFDTKKSNDDSDGFASSRSSYSSGTSWSQQTPRRQQHNTSQASNSGFLGNKIIIALVIYALLKIILTSFD